MKKKYIDHYGFDGLIHIRLAVKGGAEYFVTNNKSILEDREELERYFGILIRTPEEMNKLGKQQQ